jgi:hypothetical protein
VFPAKSGKGGFDSHTLPPLILSHSDEDYGK